MANKDIIDTRRFADAKLAQSDDILILQTPIGTKKIKFNDFNVVRTDIDGNTVLRGSLTGNDAILINLQVASITATNFLTQTSTGVSVSNGYYDRFTINGGLVTAVTSQTGQNSVYTAVTNSVMPGVSTNFMRYIRNIQEYIKGPYTFNGGVTVVQDSITINSIFRSVNFNNTPLIPAFSVMVSRPLTTFPVIYDITKAGNVISYKLDMGQRVPGGTQAYVRLQLINENTIVPANTAAPYRPPTT